MSQSTGTNDSELRVWKLTFKEGVETDKNLQQAPSMKKLKINEDEDSDSEAGLLTRLRLF